jgi:hypothetical protein
MLISFVSFGILGMIAEVAFGAAKSLFKDRAFELKGSTSVWMFPVYGLIAIIYPIIAMRIGVLPWYGRGAVYMLTFFVFEYIAGWILTKMKVCPWRYPEKWSIGGLVYLPYAPIWFGLGLGVEWIWPNIKAISTALT